jgi:endoglucanase
MDAATLKFLTRIVDAPGPSGYEQPVMRVFRDHVDPFADSVETDVMGSVAASRNLSGSPRIMLAGHADEIGFQVRNISDTGMLYFGMIGGHDNAIIVGQRVNVHTTSGPVPGVIGRKAIHLLEGDEREKAPKGSSLWIDIGVGTKEAAAALVSIGDCVTYAETMVQMQGTCYAARSFDNKMGAFVVAEALRRIDVAKLQGCVTAVATVQEEIGLRGARTSAYGINPDVALAVDVCHAMDFPGADKNTVGDIKLGAGPVIARGANINPKVHSLLVQVAQARGIPYQVKAVPGGTGTDANAIQVNRAGVATGLVSAPVRYMHTPGEVMDIADIDAAANLVAAFCEAVTADVDWRPL